METSTDAKLLIDYLSAQDITEPDAVKPGWNHIGAIALDAAIQQQRNYELQVRPRVERLIADHPETSTTSGFLAFAKSTDLMQAVNYHSPSRIHLAVQIAEVFHKNQIETSSDLHAALSAPETRDELRTQLWSLKYVGPKTLGYFDILAGVQDGTAVDSRVLAVFTAAGITSPNYAHSEAVIRDAAQRLGWPVGGLDSVLWRIGATAL